MWEGDPQGLRQVPRQEWQPGHGRHVSRQPGTSAGPRALHTADTPGGGTREPRPGVRAVVSSEEPELSSTVTTRSLVPLTEGLTARLTQAVGNPGGIVAISPGVSTDCRLPAPDYISSFQEVQQETTWEGRDGKSAKGQGATALPSWGKDYCPPAPPRVLLPFFHKRWVLDGSRLPAKDSAPHPPLQKGMAPKPCSGHCKKRRGGEEGSCT